MGWGSPRSLMERGVHVSSRVTFILDFLALFGPHFHSYPKITFSMFSFFFHFHTKSTVASHDWYFGSGSFRNATLPWSFGPYRCLENFPPLHSRINSLRAQCSREMNRIVECLIIKHAAATNLIRHVLENNSDHSRQDSFTWSFVIVNYYSNFLMLMLSSRLVWKDRASMREGIWQ